MPTTHTVEEGESTTSLADQYGLFTETIWNDPGNTELKQLRKNMDILMSGDVLVIPDKRLKEVSKPSGKRHRFKRKGVPALFRLQLFQRDKPRANQAYRLAVDGLLLKGQTDGNGVLQETVPTNAFEGQLIIGPDNFKLIIRFGFLDPINELSGVQKRLNNLGFDSGDADGVLSPDTVAALEAFQARFGLQVTGEVDDATRDKLEKIHDGVGKLPKDPATTS